MTTALALAFALAAMLACGTGLLLLLTASSEKRTVAEIVALGWFLGSGVISLTLWIGGWIVRGRVLQTVVTVVAFSIFACGWRSHSRQRSIGAADVKRRTVDGVLIVIVLLELVIVCVTSFKHTLGWDGLVNWEAKARYAFINDGALPPAYFSTPGREFSHQLYPLAIPFTELWVYLALGDAHQFWAKALFPIYFLAGVTFLITIVSRLTGQRIYGWLAAALLFFIPPFTTGTGGAVSGYADVPFSSLYFAAIGYALVAKVRKDPGALRISLACLSFLPWFKREGILLWMIGACCFLLCNWRERNRKIILGLCIGPMIFVAWNVFLRVMHTVVTHEYGPVPLPEIPSRLRLILHSLAAQFNPAGDWRLLWLLAGVALLQLIVHYRDRVVTTLAISIVGPIACYAGTYLFSGWPVVADHIASSLPRLLMHVTLINVAAIVLALKLTVDLLQRTFARAAIAQEPSTSPLQVIVNRSAKFATGQE